MVDNKKQEVQDLLTNHFGCKSYDFDCLEILLRKADVKLDEILEHKIIQFKKDDYKNIFHIAHRSESKLRVKDIAKVATSYEIVRGLKKQDYKELLNEIVSDRKWDVLEILLSKGKDPEGKPVTNYFLDNIDGEILLDEVIENGIAIPSDIFSKIMDGMKEATEGLFKDKLTDALNAMKDHEFIDLCAKSIESTLGLIIYLVPNKFVKTLFNIGEGNCENDLKNVIDRVTFGKDDFQNFMLQSHTVVSSGKKGEKEESHQFSIIPDFIKTCVEKVIDKDSKIKDLELVSILFDKLSGDKLEILLDNGLFTQFLNKFFDIENLKNPEFAKIADKIVMNIDNNIFNKLLSDAENNKFEIFISNYFEKLSAKELIEYSYNNYVKKGHDAIFKYLIDNKFKLNDKAGKINAEEAHLLGQKINNVLERGCINQDKIVEIFAKSEYLLILKQEDDYIDSLFTTISVLASSKSYSNTKSLISVRNYIEQVIGDQELSKTVNKALDQAVHTRDENQPILQLTGGTPVDRQDIYKFKSLFSLLDSLKNNKGVLECQTKFNKLEGDLSECTKYLNEATAKLSVHEQFATGVGTQVYKVHSDGNFADQIFTFCSGTSIALLAASTYLKMSISAAGASAARTSALDATSKLLIVGGVTAVCIPIKFYHYMTSTNTAPQITKIDDNQKKQSEVYSKNDKLNPSLTPQHTTESNKNSPEPSNSPTTSADLSATPTEMQQDQQHQHDGGEL